jgi:RNA polymerase sigma factor (sigma-70 family)
MTLQATQKVERVVTACAARAWRLAVFMVWNTEDALDVVQQACLVAASKADAIPADDPWPWFARVITLEALKLRQKRASHERLKGAACCAPTGDGMELDAALLAEKRELQEKLRESLAQLPEDQRDAVTLTQIAGLSVRDAASTLGVSSSTVDRRVQEGMAGLRKKLERKEAVLSAGLFALSIENPPQGMNAALQTWLSAIPARAETLTGVSSMKIAIFVGLGFVVLAGCCLGFFWHFHHDAAGEHMREMHDNLWRTFHGK